MNDDPDQRPYPPPKGAKKRLLDNGWAILLIVLLGAGGILLALNFVISLATAPCKGGFAP